MRGYELSFNVALTRIASQSDLSPQGRGEEPPQLVVTKPLARLPPSPRIGYGCGAFRSSVFEAIQHVSETAARPGAEHLRL